MGKSFAYTRGGLAGALKGRTVVRRCCRCGLGFPRYPGRYPAKCPQCKGDVSPVEESAMDWAKEAAGTLSDIAQSSGYTPRAGARTPRSSIVVIPGSMSDRMDIESWLRDMGASPARRRVNGWAYSFGSDGVAVLEWWSRDGYWTVRFESGRVSESASSPAVICTSMVPRIQRVLDSATPADAPDKRSSRSFIVRYDEMDRLVPGGVRALQTFMEGPARGATYFRVEDPRRPVLVMELDDTLGRARLFASDDPKTYLGYDPRQEFVDTDPVFESSYGHAVGWDRGAKRWIEAQVAKYGIEESGYGGSGIAPSSVSALAGQHAYMQSTIPVGDSTAPKRAVELAMQAATSTQTEDGKGAYYGGFHFNVGANKNRKPRTNMRRVVQNKRNARRGVAKRTKASKDWHRSSEGKAMHRALRKFNSGPLGSGNRKTEATMEGSTLGLWRPAQHLLEAASDYRETIDDVLDNILRKLLVMESLDILQDVEFDEDSGSIYLFFDPSLELDEVGELAQVLRMDYKDTMLVGAPPGAGLPANEGVAAGADWWVMFIPRPLQDGMMPQPNLRMFTDDTSTMPGPPKKQQIVVQAPTSQPEQMADQIDVDSLLADFAQPTAEALRRLPANIQERIAARMRSKAR